MFSLDSSRHSRCLLIILAFLQSDRNEHYTSRMLHSSSLCGLAFFRTGVLAYRQPTFFAPCIRGRILFCPPSSTRSKSSVMGEQPIPWEQVVPGAYNTSPASITRDALLEMFRAGRKPGLNFLLVDVRREDHKVSSDCPSARYFRY